MAGQSIMAHNEEHFVTKKLANVFPKKQFRDLLRKKMNIAVDKHPQTNTVKILHKCFFGFFSFKVKHVM